MSRILIVDDAAVMRMMIKAILSDAGHEVVGEAANGQIAINQYMKHQPDLVTMDLTMPDVDGLQAVEGIMNHFPEAKIIMISAIAQKDLIIKALRLGAKNYILKPITAEKVVSVVNSVLGTTNKINEKKPVMRVDIKGFDDKIRELKKSINQVDQSIKDYDTNKRR